MKFRKRLQLYMAGIIAFTMVFGLGGVQGIVSYAEDSAKNDYDAVCLFDLGSLDFQTALNADGEYLRSYSGGRFQSVVTDGDADYSYEWDVNGAGCRMRMGRFFRTKAKISDYLGKDYHFCVRLKAASVSGNSVPLNMYFANTYISNPGNHQADKTFMVATDEWNDYYMPLDNLSGAVIAGGENEGHMSSVLWQSGAGAEPDSKIYIDRIFIGKVVPAGTELSAPVSNIDGKNSLSPDIDGDKTVYFTFSDTMQLPEESAIEVLKDGALMLPEDDYRISLDESEKIIKIAFNNILSGGADYKITLKENQIFSKKRKVLKSSVIKEFTSDTGSGFVTFGTSELTTGSTVRAEFYAEEGSTFHMSSYSSGGKLLSSAPNDGTDKRELAATSNTAYVKAYILNKSGALTHFSELNTNGKISSSIGEHSAGLSSFKQKDGPVTGVYASGIADAGFLPVLITVTAPDGEILVCEPVATGAAGELEYNYVFDDCIDTDMYRVQASLAGIISEYDLGYLKASEFLEKANSGDESVLSAWMIAKAAMFSQYFSGEASVKDAAKIITENMPYADYAELYTVLEKIRETVDKLNSALWSDLSEYLHANPDFILNSGSEEWKYFDGLTDSQKNLICRDVLKNIPFDTVTDFRIKFKNSAEKHKSEQKKDNKDNGVYGGYGGGGGGRVTKSLTVVSSKPEANGADNENPDIPAAENPFSDMSGFEWAKESVCSLFKKGIISESDNEKYRPADNVTREEFVKLITAAFFPEKEGSQHKFADEAANGWYNKALSVAHELKIVFGRPDGSFGVGESISRQDMCVMLYRVMQLKGIDAGQCEIDSFADSQDVSAYAREAVAAMAEKNIVRGTGNNELSPNLSVNRAQAACVIDRMMNLKEAKSK
mgnify:CR=1 FL=1